MQSSSHTDNLLRLAIVVPRFGEHVSGGAELLAKWLAERLAKVGHEVDIYTTCAVDHVSWRNELPAGVESHGGLRVLRFPTNSREVGVYGELSLAIVAGHRLSFDEELLWLRHGVSSEAMEETLTERADRYDAVLAMPYLWGTTYFAYASCPSKAVIVPCLHDEPFSRLSFVTEMLAGARGLIFNTDAEASLAARLVPMLAPWGVVGAGIDPVAVGTRRRRERMKLPEPSLLYVGRREAGKNTPLLIDYFTRYRKRCDRLVLAFAGGGSDPLPKHRDIVKVKPDWKRPHSMYEAATVLCQPSTNESLSIVLLQGWLAGLPALVHRDCEVTRMHCERSNAGLWFASYAEFEEVLDRLLRSPELRQALGSNGRRYVEREYSWAAVLERFHKSMDRILGTRMAAAETETS